MSPHPMTAIPIFDIGRPSPPSPHALDRRGGALLRRFYPRVEDRHRREVDRIGERRMEGIASLEMVEEFLPDRGAAPRQGLALFHHARRLGAAVAIDQG